jgi:hypothetical protein
MAGGAVKQISFMLTEPQIMAGTKSVTRRWGWTTAKPGQLLQGVRKSQGLKKGEHVHKLRVIRVLNARRERLARLVDEPEYGAAEMVREGFPGRDPADFVTGYFGGRAREFVTRIEFEYVD